MNWHGSTCENSAEVVCSFGSIWAMYSTSRNNKSGCVVPVRIKIERVCSNVNDKFEYPTFRCRLMLKMPFYDINFPCNYFFEFLSQTFGCYLYIETFIYFKMVQEPKPRDIIGWGAELVMYLGVSILWKTLWWWLLWPTLIL